LLSEDKSAVLPTRIERDLFQQVSQLARTEFRETNPQIVFMVHVARCNWADLQALAVQKEKALDVS
jgi:hypothetical protein